MLKIILTIGAIQALAIFVNLIRSKVVAVLLGPEGVGVISTIDQVVQFAAYISALSLPLASVKFLSRAHSEGHESFSRSYSSFLKALLILAGVGTIVTIGLAFFQASLLGPEIFKYRTILIVALLGLPTMILGVFLSSVLASAQKPNASSVLAVITNSSLMIASAVGVLLGGVLGLYTGTSLAGAMITLGLLIYFRQSLALPLYDRNASIHRELKQNPSVILFSFILYLSSVTYSFSYLMARYAVLKNYGEAQAGLLQAVIALSLAIGMVLNPANGLFLTPIMNRNISKEEKLHAASEFGKRLVVILSVVAMPIVLFPQIILTILFSSKFVIAGQFVFLFVAAQCLTQLAGVNQALLIGFDDLKIYSLITCPAQVAAGLIALLLVPRIGIIGVCLGFLVSSSAILLLTAARLKFKHGSSLRESLTLLVGYSLPLILVAGAVSIKYAEWSLLVVLVKVGGYLLFLAGLLLFLNKDERILLYDLRHKLKIGVV